MRCFVAVDLDNGVREKLRAVQAEMRNTGTRVRFIDPTAIHVTLKFLGSIQEDWLSRIKQSLAQCSIMRPFDVHARRLGAFPKLSSPRVFWAGVDPQPSLGHLQCRVEEELAWTGIKDERAFHPHLTLARVGERKGLEPLIDYIKINGESFDAGSFTVRDFHLYQSILKPNGAQYVKLASFALT
ncbi:MAG TPA: RNA 2',3'-cyclic phosphodiesterase [Acidobacteriota bacterium]